jgi:tripartite-type tricarboxylate transporter receptor subunit TctC
VAARTPNTIAAQLHREIVRSTQASDVHSRFVSLGLEPVGNGPAEFSRIIRDDLSRWAKVVRNANIRID